MKLRPLEFPGRVRAFSDFAAEAAGVEVEGPEAVGPGDTVVPTEGEPEPAEAAAPGERPEADGGGCVALLGDTCIADSLAALTVSCHAACSAAKRALEISRFAWTRSGEPTSLSSSACACCLASSWRRALAGDTLVGEPNRGTEGGAAGAADPGDGDGTEDGRGGTVGGRSDGDADASSGMPSTPICCPSRGARHARPCSGRRCHGSRPSARLRPRPGQR